MNVEIGRLGAWAHCVTLSTTVMVAFLPSLPFAAEPGSPDTQRQGQLQLLDGSTLRGSLNQFKDKGKIIHWTHPDIEAPMRLPSSSLSSIWFNHPNLKKEMTPTHRFRFHNGDEIYGRLVSFEKQELILESKLTGLLKTNRKSVQAIERLPDDFTIVYEGPGGLDGWSLGNRQPGWSFQDGALVSKKAGILGRDFRSIRSSTLSFDLSWQERFALLVSCYTKVINRVDYSNSAYKFYFGVGFVSLRKTETGAGPVNLGRVEVPSMSQTESVSVQINFNIPHGSIDMSINGEWVAHWQEKEELLTDGSGIVFYNQRDGLEVSLRNIRLTSWDGNLAIPEVSGMPEDKDWLCLINRDRLGGQISRISGQLLHFGIDTGEFQIPMDRVTHIFFQKPPQKPTPNQPDAIQLFIAGGGRLNVHLNGWDKNKVRGINSNFGTVELDVNTLRRIRFNLDRPKQDPAGQAPWDAGIWEDSEG